jgi:uncharacterized protein DUF2716
MRSRGEEEEGLWAALAGRFAFQPRTYESESGIIEPLGSVTIDLAPAFAVSPAGYAAAERAVNALALLAMVEVFPAGEPLMVLDRQHSSYRFWPHRQAVNVDPTWPVEVFPTAITTSS